MSNIKGTATINVFKTSSGEGARIVIPKKIIEALDIKKGDTFSQIIVGKHIEMEETCIIDDNTVSINQYETKSNIVTRVYLLKNIVEGLKLKDKDMLLFELQGKKIIIKKF